MPGLPPVSAWIDVSFDSATAIATDETCYQDNRRRLWNATYSIRFATKDNIQRAICNAGLSVESWLGDWQGSAFTAQSPEMIPVGHHSEPQFA